jgi:hypothetical protein
MATWVVQSNFLDINQINPLVEALRARDIPFVDVGVIPFSDEFVTPIDVQDDVIIPYGSTRLCNIAEKRGWKGLYFDRAVNRADVWNKHRDDMLNGDAEFMTVGEASVIFGERADEDVWFIRPVEDLKQFNGTVTTSAEIRRWMTSIESGNFSFGEDTVVAVSKPKDILMEWRYFVVGGKIVTGSSYRMRGLKLTRRETDEKVIAEAQSLAEKWLPHENVVMDLALTDDGLKVVEFNCINGSGFYYHDIPAFAVALTEYARNQ